MVKKSSIIFFSGFFKNKKLENAIYQNLSYRRLKFLCYILLLSSLFAIDAKAQQFITRGDATKISEKCYKITDNSTNRRGAIWWDTKLDLTKPLELDFIIYMGDKDTGADGIAFVMHNDPSGVDAKGEAGGGLYFGDHPSQSGSTKISPSVAIEFDTYRNSNCDSYIGKDPSFDHTTVVYNGNMCTGAQFTPLKINASYENLENNACFSYRVKWDPGTKELKLFVDNKLIFTHTDDIVKNVFSNTSSVYYGFTGSTGGAINEQTVCVLNGNTTPVAINDAAATPFNTSVTIDALSNDNDADGDALILSKINVAPKNGSATVINNKIQYTPGSSFAGKDSVQYEVCDGSVDKCYSNCSLGWAYITVDCPSYSVGIDKINDNDKCDEVNGIDNGAASAYVLVNGEKVTANFTFLWSRGTSVKAVPDYTGSIYSGLPDGDYTVTARNDNTLCYSDANTVTIKRISNNPEVKIISDRHLTDCKNPNGKLSAFAVVNGVNTITGHSFLWYEQSAGLSGEPLSKSHVVNSLKAEQYVVVVTNNISGCRSVAQFTVENQAEVATLSAQVLTHITRCDQPNSGVLKASVLEGENKFRFNWYKGKEINTSQKLNEVGAQISGLEAGFYTVTATSISSTCTTEPIVLEIENQTKKPDVTTSVTSLQTSCDPTAPNGSLTANASSTGGEPAGGYLFEWFRGSNTVTLIGAGKTITGLKADTYTVRVTNQTTKCFNTQSILLKDNLTLPSVTATKTDLTFCSPLNGTVTATTGGNNTNYTFTWYRGTTVNAANIISGTGASRSGLDLGDYTVTATDNTTKCISSHYIVKIEDKRIYPDLKITPTPQTVCNGSPNGQLDVDVMVNGSADAASGYTFNWYAGNGTGGTKITTTSGTNGKTATGLAAGSYTVEVINNATGCVTIKPASVKDDLVRPVISPVVAQHLTICDPAAYNGAINSTLTFKSAAVPTGDESNYTFTWYAGADITYPVIAGKTTLNIAGLNAGTYTVTATHNDLGCVSTPANVTINDNTVDPVITIAETPQTSCTATPNGQLNANVEVGGTPVDPANYTFTWYEGNGTGGNVVSTTTGTNGKTVAGLAIGQYTVEVRNIATGCVSTKPITLTEDIKYPVISPVVTQHLTICDPTAYDGAINSTLRFRGASVPTADEGNYTFTWYAGADVTAPVITDKTTLSISGLNSGTYTVTATHNGLGCTSAPANVTINDNTVDPVITIAETPQTSCTATPNGQLDAGVEVGGTPDDPANYTFTWYEGNGTSGNVIASTSGINGKTATDLAAGQYTVEVKNIATGCVSTKPFTLEDDIKYPIVSAVITQHLTICGPTSSFNGKITAGITFRGAPVSSSDPDYEFTWYDGENVLAPVISGEESFDLDGRGAGKFTVTVSNTKLGCTSAPVTVTIKDETVLPDIKITATPQTACSSDFNGQLDADVMISGAPDNPNNYTFTWYEGNGTGGNVIATTSGINGKTVTDLAAGQYTVEVTNIATRCVSTKPFTLENDIKYPVVSATVAQHLTICDPASSFNGKITADITLRGASVSSSDPDYEFTWYDGENVLAPIISGEEGFELDGRGAGKITVTVTNTVLGCTSAPLTVTIKDETVNPDISITETPQTSCSTDFNGQLDAHVMISGAPDDPNNYTFTWYEGNGTGGNVIATTLGINGKTVTDLAAGQYTVEVTNIATGCVSTKPFTLEDDIKYPVVSAAVAQHLTICDPASSFNGKITADITLRGVSISSSDPDYEFTWYDGENVLAPIISGEEGFELDGRGAGKFTVTVTNTVLGCTSAPVTVTIKDETVNPDISITETPQTSCSTDFNGQLDADVMISGAPDDPNNYTFTWYEGNGTGGNVITTTSGTNGKIAIDLAAGQYTVEVTNIATGCVSTKPVTLEEDITIPVLTIDVTSGITPFTNCNTPDGGITTSISGGPAPSGYAYTWYRGESVDPANVIPGETGSSLIGVTPGDYTVLATDVYTTCQSNEVTVQIDEIPDLTIDDFEETQAQECNNGTNVLVETGGYEIKKINGIVLPDSRFSFQWYLGSPEDPNATYYTDPAVNFPGGTGFNSSATGTNTNSLQKIPAGVYSVEITDNLTGCKHFKTFVVPFLQAEELDLALTKIEHSTTCVAPGNGYIEVELKNYPTSRTSADYTFSWYIGSNPVPSQELKYQDGTQITGNILSSLNGLPGDLPSLPSGTYSAIATQNFGDNCPSHPLVITIEQHSVAPVLTTEENRNNTFCSGYDGYIRISAAKKDAVDDESNGYRFEWFEDAALTIAAKSPEDVTTPNGSGLFESELEDVNGGDYYARVTNLKTNCFEVKKFSILNKPFLPVITDADVVDQNTCKPSGSITIEDSYITASNNGTADYTFTWYRGSANYEAGTPISGVTGNELNAVNYTAIGAGTYYVVATKKTSADGLGLGCPSEVYQTVIKDISNPPAITLENNSPNTNCVGSDGSLTVSAATVATTDVESSGYRFEWFTGNTAAGSPFRNETVSVAPFEDTAPDLAQGNYTVRITNIETGCQEVKTYTVENDLKKPKLTGAEVVPQATCKASGSITIRSVDIDAPSTDPNDYTFTWYRGSANYEAGTPISGVTVNLLNNLNYNTIGAGTYYVVAKRNGTPAGQGLGCTTNEPLIVEIEDISNPPAITLENNSPNTNCAGSDGSLTVSAATVATTDVESSGYRFEWFTGNTAAGSPFRNETVSVATFEDTAPDLAQGNYTVRITNIETGCQEVKTYTVENDLKKPKLTGAEVVPQATCKASGSITIRSSDIDAPSTDPNDYTFTWYRGSANYEAGTPISGVTVNVLNNLNYNTIGAGTYYVVAKRNGTPAGQGLGCTTNEPLIVTIEDISNPPAITLENNSPNTNCAGSDGSLTVSAATVATTDVESSGYRFEWFTGNTVAGSTFRNETVSLAPFEDTAPDLAQGNYTVRILNIATGCSETKTYTVENDLKKPKLTGAEVVPQATCKASGSITIRSVDIDAPSTDPNDYTFTWYRGTANYEAGTPISGVTVNVLNNLNYNTIGAGTYYVVAKRNNTPAGQGLGCTTDEPLIVTIEDISNPPAITLENNSPNTNCSGSDGSLTVSATTVATTDVESSGYQFEWFTGNTDAGSSFRDEAVSVAPFEDTAPDLAQGNYTVRITNIETGCQEVKTYTVENDLKKPKLTGAEVVPQAMCKASGSITIRSSDIDAPSTDPNDYTFTWYRGTANYEAGTPISGVTVNVLNNLNYNTIGAGTYYVVAKRNGTPAGQGLGCTTNEPLIVEIKDISNPPAITLESNSPNTNCSGSDGSLTVSATTVATTDVESSGYRFEWFTGNTDAGSPFRNETVSVAPFEDTAPDLAQGNYTVRITNIETGCQEVKTYTVEDDLQFPAILATSDVDQSTCDFPSGSITITNITASPNGTNDYTFTWYKGRSNYDANNSIAGQSGHQLTGLTADTYFVIATRNPLPKGPGLSCESEPFQVVIHDISKAPLISFANKKPNTYCDGSDGAIEIIASVDPDDTVTPTTYSYSFTSDTPIPPAAVTTWGASLQLNDLRPGNYTVTVTSNSTGCSNIADFTIEDKPFEPVIFDALVIDQNTCDPSGSISIANNQITASANGTDDYTFEWYRESTNPGDLVLSGSEPVLDKNSYPNIGAGIYFVKATKKSTAGGLGIGCTSQFLEKEIKDIAVYPVLTLKQKSNTVCDPNLSNGTLEVFADNAPASDYTYQWYYGASPITASSTPVPDLEGGKSEKILNQKSGTYTVEVTSNATQCPTTISGIIVDNPINVSLRLNSMPRFNCDIPDGTVYVDISTPVLEEDQQPSTYSYKWYSGPTASGPEISITNEAKNLDIGVYTVVATDAIDPFCPSITGQVTVLDAREGPSEIIIVQDAPVSNCDPSRPNGQLSVSVNGRIDQHEFTWYEGTQASGNILAQGPSISNLSATNYTVVAKDRLTKCTASKTTIVQEQLEPVPAPIPEVISHMNRCDYFNGTLTASVNGNQASYIFNWYRGEIASGNPVYTGLEFTDLPVGRYAVTATDKTTGCVSAAASIEIVDTRLYPDFTISTKSSLCQKETGSGSTEFAPEYEIATIVWEKGSFSVSETDPDGLAPGEYQVIATGLNGCVTTKTTVVGAELEVFNGVTPNGDNRNDRFIIDCIESVPNNQVKIFNRAGALVYEMERYNNADVSFEGIGNRGMYIGSKELPDGTYFYVIDKKDGSRPITGYLELLR